MARELELLYPERREKLYINEWIIEGNTWHSKDYQATVLTNMRHVMNFISAYTEAPYGRQICTLANGTSIYLRVTIPSVYYFTWYLIDKDDNVKASTPTSYSTSINYFWYLSGSESNDTIAVIDGVYNTDTAGHISEEEFAGSYLVSYDNIPQVMGASTNPEGRVKMSITPVTSSKPAVASSWSITYEDFLEGATEGIDPYGPIAGNSTPGGAGTFNFKTDGFSFPSNPTLSQANTGFTTTYMPSQLQLQQLHDYLWNDNMATYLRKFFESTSDAIVNLMIAPVRATTVDKVLKYGLIGSGVTLPAITSYYSQVTFSLDIDKCFDSALDYEPYTTVELILPYYGSVQVEPEYIQGQSVKITYKTEITTGDCVIYVYTGSSPNIKIITTLNCNVSTNVMISGGDKGIGQLTNLLMTTATVAASVAAKGSALSPNNGADIGSQLISSVVNAKPQLTHSGQIAGSMKHGHWGVPYLVIKRAHPVLPDRYNQIFGFACNYTAKLSSCNGYTSCQIVHVSDVPEYCTESEREEIESLLLGGVIL